MRRFSAITYTQHARLRMRQRGIAEEEVNAALAIGDAYRDEDDLWIYELRPIHARGIRVIVSEAGDLARVITVIRLRKRT